MARNPKHEQIANELRDRILAGQYGNSEMPPELKLVEEFGASRHTVRSALQRLVRDGLIVRRAGIGTRVNDRADISSWGIESVEDLIGEFNVEQSQTLHAGLISALSSAHAAKTLGVRRNAKIYHILRLFPSSDPFAVSHVFTTARLASRLSAEEINRKPVIKLIEQHCRVDAASARQVASAASADETLANQLGIKIGDPLLILHRTYFTSDKKAILHSEMSIRPDRYAQIVKFIREGPVDYRQRHPEA